MIVQLIIAVLFGTLGSYFSFFNPKLLSKNITELSSARQKWIASFVSVIAITLLLFHTDPKTGLGWLEFGFISVFYFIAVIDLYAKIIPNRMILLLLGITALKLVLNFDPDLLVAAGVVFIILTIANLSINKFFKKVLFGWGDIKLIGVLGLYLGWEVLWVVYIAIILGGLLSVFGIASRKISRTRKITFAIFLFLGMQILRLEVIRIFFCL